MPVIAVAQAKGGAGKSTATLVLATYLAEAAGASVCVIDADKNRPILDFKEKGESKSTINVVLGEEATLVKTIVNQSKTHQFVFVDVEGSANLSISYAIAKADLVIVPMQASALEARKVGDVLDLIAQQEAILDHPIPYRVLLNRTPANDKIVPRLLREIIAMLEGEGVETFKTSLVDRQAYKLIFSERLTLHELPDPYGAVAKAIDNVGRLAEEVVSFLESGVGDSAQ